MKKNSIIRNYHFTDAALSMKVKEKIAFIQRDIDAFETFGITAISIAALQNELDTFTELETDIEIKGNQTIASATKKAKARELTEAIKTVMTIVSIHFQKDSKQYYHFGTGNIMNQREADLYITARLVIRRATQYLPELTPHGLTMAHLDSIALLNEQYCELIIDQQLAKSERQIYREKRIAIGNGIYKILLQYMGIGLAYWETRSKAKYNDYLLYNEKKKAKLRIA